MITAVLTIGYTQSDRLNDYVPFDDGYRAGAVQEFAPPLMVSVEPLDARPVALDLAEAAFVATNAPDMSCAIGPIQRAVWEAAAQAAPLQRAVSVGDTVRVTLISNEIFGAIDVLIACERSGWTIVRQA